jgi:cell division protein FtsB
MRHSRFDAFTIKELRAQYAELSRRYASVSQLNTALRNENASLRREIERLSKAGNNGEQKGKARGAKA